ncbi:MAG: rod shape-determining protein MreD [Gemmatimonadaceae bacterium]|nr:rod shape-determining protein MreD [Gemmatimonadaceae bacterium]
MSASRSLLLAAWVAALVTLHFTLRPFLGWRVQADFLVIALMLVAVRSRPAVAAVVGLVIGMATDSLSPATFGAGALALTVVGFAASRLKAVFFAENLALNGIFIFAGKWLFDAVYVFAARSTHGPALAMQLAVWSVLAAGLTAVVGLAVLAWSRPPASRLRA